MDPLDRADAALARARARGAFVVTPEDAVSPMDAANTLQIPRTVVNEIDRDEDDLRDTMIVSQTPLRGQPTQPLPEQPHVQPRGPQPLGHQPPQPLPQQQQQQPQRSHVEVEQWRQEPQNRQTTEQFEQPQPHMRHEEGIVPTLKQDPPPTRPSLTQRLDGQRRTLG